MDEQSGMIHAVLLVIAMATTLAKMWRWAMWRWATGLGAAFGITLMMGQSARDLCKDGWRGHKYPPMPRRRTAHLR